MPDDIAPRTVFTSTEVAYAVWLVSKLDPARYSNAETKALIAKAKACADAGHLPVAQPAPTRVTVRRRGWSVG